MNRRLSQSILGLAFLYSFSNVIAADKAARFPGLIDRLRSPNARYTLYNVDDEKEPHHALVLEDHRDKTKTKIYTYGRYVDVFWSPGSDAVVVNDHAGSDYSTCVIITVKDGNKLDLSTKIKQKLTDNFHIVRNHHVYVTCEGWLTAKIIMVKTTGYGDFDPNGFSMWYEYRMDNGSFKSASAPKNVR